jgi:hypothetical protein
MNAFSGFVRIAIASVVLAGCVQPPPEPMPSSSVSIPAAWPEQVPLYDSGELVAATVNPDGSAVAMWRVTGLPEKRVMGAYHKALHKAGFRTTDWFSDLAGTGYDYRGHGLVVRAGTIDVGDSVSLSVDVTCVKDCPATQ